MTTRFDASRRHTLAQGLALGSGALLPAGAALAQMVPLAKQQLRTIGLSVTVQERILADFKAQSGVAKTVGTAATHPDAQTRILSGAKDFDVWETNAERLPALVMTNKLTPVPTAALKHWGQIRDTFTRPDPKLPAKAQIAGQIRADAAQTALYMVPTVYNYDSIGYHPGVLSAEEANSWTALFDKKWKGRSGLNTDPLIATGEAILAMNSLGLSDVKNPGNPNKKEIDEAIGFLISKKKQGQFRALWGDFGELVNLLASGEMVVCDAWQPAVMAVKAQGRPCKYATPKEGYRAWAIGVAVLATTPHREAAIAYADYWLSGPPAIAVSEQGYYSPSTSVRQVMAPQKYAFWYEGAPWVGATERGIREGDLRDGGALAQRAAQVAYWHQWPDSYDHLVQKWNEFLTA
ncbi:extracellular solute-binding protein [Verminephrobacter aporrectodeae subsp. tuberculatae]|uniref:Extracellular solute-binding protein n=1 Tax=Verminephrobacter aporrectodeae subsp. tuberculatae TaxID=1110392 RepID=A0ABT3KVR2_9BURK|nr:extracellular solute-binding protein [Verminephrobacter aporrectodeae]MCW5223306.1 extracellular solute-binding protein [Verminephrobacter aporrectodeae subsp. tuberculatae]MCW5256482.1 extracellular solute-binding protein [Verminephrobacter aporrectodeae subsp. tuberculatae]MCW5288770.1 extracellular solute-binding protein [Verminephrobacter aporrectodeae subsp. tuberculatae]MCW5322360.1 extracellular solute-binding protein [Verminephrobacter aporrectodeae subsp. tuberculatae]MCW8166239.1 